MLNMITVRYGVWWNIHNKLGMKCIHMVNHTFYITYIRKIVRHTIPYIYDVMCTVQVTLHYITPNHTNKLSTHMVNIRKHLQYMRSTLYHYICKITLQTINMRKTMQPHCAYSLETVHNQIIHFKYMRCIWYIHDYQKSHEWHHICIH